MSNTRVWDGPTRLFHWLLVLLFGFSWWSAENGAMDWHRLSGSVLLGLILFRLIWGVVGSSTARFANFVKSPTSVQAWLRSGVREEATGHNPLGGYSVIAMLFALAAQISSGLFAVDVDGLESGPLSFLVSFEAGRAAADMHETSFIILLLLIVLHLLAIGYYSFRKKQPLIRRMITGQGAGNMGMQPASVARFLGAAITAAALAWWLSQGLGL